MGIFLQFLLVSVIFTEIGFFLDNSMLISVSNNFSIFLLILMFGFQFKKIRKIDFLDTIFVLTVVLINYFVKISLSIDPNGRDLLYLGIISIALILSRTMRLSLSDFRFFKVALYILTLIYFKESFNSVSYGMYPFNLLMFGYSNPNVLASVLLTNVVFFCILKSKRKSMVLADIVMILMNIYLLYLTGSRTGLFSAVIMIFFSIFISKLPKVIVASVGYISSLFPFLIMVINNLSNFFMLQLGKIIETQKVNNLNGRDRIWYEQLKVLLDNAVYFLFGAQPPNYSLTYRTSHNYLLSIFFKNGFIVLVSYIYILFGTLKVRIKNVDSDQNKLMILAWFVIVLASSYESYLSSGIISISILWTFLLAEFKKSDKREKIF